MYNKPCVSITGSRATTFSARLRDQCRDLIQPGARVQIIESSKVIKYHFLSDGEEPTGEVRVLAFEGSNPRLYFSPIDRNPDYFGTYPAVRKGRDIAINKTNRI